MSTSLRTKSKYETIPLENADKMGHFGNLEMSPRLPNARSCLPELAIPR